MNLGPVWLRKFEAGALIFCVTLLAYLPSFSGDFIWNDSDYVTAPALRSLGGLGRIWTEPGATQQYYPLLHSAFWVQHRLWGDHPLGYHIVTVLMHAGSAVLFLLILRRLSCPGAWLAALLFALHPVHVESVAWITEQKNTLSLAFYLAAALFYLRFDETRQPRTYVAALALFILSMLSKTVTATLPAALLVVFWWKRGRLRWRTDLLPLLPWMAVGACSGLFSSWVERHYLVAEGTDFSLSLLGRLLVAGRAIWFYAETLVWPFSLNFIYPRWTIDVAAWQQWLFPIGVLALGAGLWALRQRTRAPLAAFLFFVGSLFPVLGFVNLYGSLYSWVWDHWQYLPDLGLLALAGAGLAQGLDWAAIRFRGLGPALVAALAIGLGTLAWNHCGMFHDDETLYRTTIARNPACWLAHINLASELRRSPGHTAEALDHYAQALRLRPDSSEAHNNMANELVKLPGRMSEALAHFERALQLRPDFVEAHVNLANALARLPDRQSEALDHYRTALRLDPDAPETHYCLANVLAGMPGRAGEAQAEYEEALRLSPEFAEAHANLAGLLARMPGGVPEALAHYEAALRLRPDQAQTHYDFAVALELAPGRTAEAFAQYQEALRLDPDYAEAYNNLGILYAKAGRLEEARARWETAVKLKPNYEDARRNLEKLQQIQQR
jgi:tetratricopeptide (TPR) repeat protein